MAASDIADELPGKLQKVGDSLHRLAGSARAIGSTVMRPDDPYVLSQLQFHGWKADLTAIMERAMFGDKWDPANPHPGRMLHPTEKWEMETPLGTVKVTRPEWTAFVDTVYSGMAASLRYSAAGALTRLVRKATSEDAKSLSECIITEANTISAIKSEAVKMNANSDDAGTILRVLFSNGHPTLSVHTKDNFSDLMTKPCGKEEFKNFLDVFCGFKRWVINYQRQTMTFT